MRPWLDNDLDYLCRLCAHEPPLSWSQIGHILNRPPSGCCETAREMGIRKQPCRPREPWKMVAA